MSDSDRVGEIVAHKLIAEPGDTVFFDVNSAVTMTAEQRERVLEALRDNLPDGVNAAITEGVRPHHVERTERRAALRGAAFALVGAVIGIVLSGAMQAVWL